MPAESVIYLRGAFPNLPEEMINQKFLADAKLVLELPIDEVAEIGESLSRFPGFLDSKSLHDVVGSIVRSEDHALSTGRLIFNVSEIFRVSGRDIRNLSSQLEAWQKIDENHKVLSSEELGELLHRLRLLIRPFDGFKRYAKARRLEKATGLILKEIEVICDLRPVFNEERTRVEGAFPYTILKVVCVGVDGLPISLEAILTDQNVAELAKKVEAATTKLRSLKELLIAKGIRIPALGPSTEESE